MIHGNANIKQYKTIQLLSGTFFACLFFTYNFYLLRILTAYLP